MGFLVVLVFWVRDKVLRTVRFSSQIHETLGCVCVPKIARPYAKKPWYIPRLLWYGTTIEYHGFWCFLVLLAQIRFEKLREFRWL